MLKKVSLPDQDYTMEEKEFVQGTSLVVQWIRICLLQGLWV